MSALTPLRRTFLAGVLLVAGVVLPRPAFASLCDVQTKAIPSICGQAPALCTFDDFPAYSYCGDFPVWSCDGRHTYDTDPGGCARSNSKYGYQCVELALRYFFFRWGVHYPWSPGFSYAWEMCTHYPSDHVSATDTPVPGDLMVMSPFTCIALDYGHVAVVNGVQKDENGNITSVALVQQNAASPATVQHSCARCYLHAKNNIRVCETLPPPDITPSNDPSVGLYFACGNATRDRNDNAWEDWSYGYYKADCSLSQAATGLSMSKDGYRYAHMLLCREDDPVRYPHTETYETCSTVVFNVEDNQRTTISGDWDPGFLKGECAEDEFVAGVSQTTNQALHAIQCCKGQVAHDYCEYLVFDSQDAREDTTANDWDPDYYKGECGPGRYIAGVSMTPLTGVPHAILCCGKPEVETPDAGLPDAIAPETDGSLPEADAGSSGSSEGGCQCRARGRGLRGLLWIILMCAALALRRRWHRHRFYE